MVKKLIISLPDFEIDFVYNISVKISNQIHSR